MKLRFRRKRRAWREKTERTRAPCGYGAVLRFLGRILAPNPGVIRRTGAVRSHPRDGTVIRSHASSSMVELLALTCTNPSEPIPSESIPSEPDAQIPKTPHAHEAVLFPCIPTPPPVGFFPPPRNRRWGKSPAPLLCGCEGNSQWCTSPQLQPLSLTELQVVSVWVKPHFAPKPAAAAFGAAGTVKNGSTDVEYGPVQE